jgi:DNA repair protein RadC
MPWVLSSPVKCEEYLRTLWDKDTIDLREEFVVVCLNPALEVLGWVKLHTGAMDRAVIDTRLVFAVALQTASAALIVAHNHPTGKLIPSDADVETTRRLRDGGKLLGLQFLDHVILNRESYYSFAESGYL